jgi:gliding motility-associated-like protein
MKNLFTLILLFASIYSNAQSVDCETATPVCSNGAINENSFGSGADDFANPNNGSGCLVGDEHQSLWLFIQIESGNTLGFDITPSGLDDYDFAVYGPNVECGDLGEPTRCSYAAPSLFGGDATGMNANANDFSETAAGDGYVRWLDVTPGETYYILVDNFSASSVGFNLEWTGNAVLNCNVTLPCPVVELGNDTTLCDGQSIVLGGPSSPLEDYLWNTGATTSTITTDDAGTYILSVTKDTCTVTDTIVITVATSPSVNLGQNVVLCPGQSVTFDATHPNATSYLWQDGSTNPTFTASSTSVVSVVVSNGECSVSDQVNVTVQNLAVPNPNIQGPSAICPGDQTILSTPFVNGNAYTWNTGASGNQITIANGGTFIVTESNACFTVRDTIIVDQLSFVEVDLGNDTALCLGETITFNVSDNSATGYLWQDGSTAPTFTVTETGTYSVEITSGICVSSDEIEVVIQDFETPTPLIRGEEEICAGEILELSTIFNEFHTYLWSTGETTPTINITEGGTYWVIESNPCGEATDTLIVVELASVPVELGDEVVLCVGETVTFDVFNQSATSYLWQDGSTESSITITASTLVNVAVSNGICTTYDTVNVVIEEFQEPNPNIQGETLLCDGGPNVLSIVPQAFHSYLWSDGSTGNSIEISEGGIYWVEETNSCFSSRDSITIQTGESPEFEIVGNLEICEDETIELSVELAQGESVVWSTQAQTPTITIFEAGIYIATVTSQCGSVSDTVEVVESECECKYFIPNAFSPNGDNLNDVFRPTLSTSITNITIEIYNRWGSLVYQNAGPTFSWDGVFDGEDMATDVYSYYIEMECSVDGSILKEKGTVTVVR